VTYSVARLAWRNLWRHRSRTVLLLVVVAYGTLGAEGRQVVLMILTESALLCLTAAAVGLAAGLAAGLGAVAALAPGFTLAGFEGLYAALGISPVPYPSVSADQVAFALVFALVTAIAAALWPALPATCIEPAEAMRHAA